MLITTVVLASFFVVESGCSQSVTNWGQSSCGCQLSIGMKTNIVTVGSAYDFHVRIRNLSKSVIKLNLLSSDLYLTNNAGKIYRVPASETINAIPGKPRVEPGEIMEMAWVVEFDKNLESGDYMFKPITVDIETDSKLCTLTSNSLKVKIVKSD